MSFLIRAINRENWPEPEEGDMAFRIRILRADALNDLKTQDDTLSAWYARDDSDIGEAILAYLGSLDRWIVQAKRGMETQDFIVLDERDVPKGIRLRQTGNLPISKDMTSDIAISRD